MSTIRWICEFTSKEMCQVGCKPLLPVYRVTTCLENLEMSENLTAVREMLGNLLKIWEMSGKKLVREKLPKTVYCKLHICVHTGI